MNESYSLMHKDKGRELYAKNTPAMKTYGEQDI